MNDERDRPPTSDVRAARKLIAHSAKDSKISSELAKVMMIYPSCAQVMNIAREFGKQGVEDESADALYREGVKRIDIDIMSELVDLHGWTFNGND
eukprot:4583673-Pyramimonas_sp.AAC.1